MSPLTEPTKLVLAKGFTWNETVWNPRMVSGLELWFDAADSSTVFSDAGVTQATNNSTVQQWNDKSGYARHISQATSVQRPILNTIGLNSKPTIAFDGNNDILLNQNANSVGVTNVTLIALMKYVSASGEDFPMGIGRTAGARDMRSFYRTNGGTTQGFATWTSDVTSSSLSTDTGGSHHSFVAVMLNSTSVNLYRDGTIDSGAPRSLSGPAALATTFNGFSIGSLQGVSVANYYSNIEMSEAIVFYRAITDTERQRIEGYLAHKWGLTASLPADHPYKTVGPTP